jgi:hypothetical protein
MIFKNLKRIIASTIMIMALVAMNPIAAHAEWIPSEGGWWYSQGNSYSVGWSQINGQWYYFDSDGYMKTGWIMNSGNLYYLKPNGSMVHDSYIGNYYFDNNGVCQLQNDIGTTTNTITEYKGFTVKYPSSWIKSTNDGLTVYYLDSDGTNVNVLTGSMKGLSEKDFLNASCEQLKNITDIDEIRVSEQMINSKRVDVLDYIMKIDKFNIPAHQVIFYNNDQAVLFTIGGADQVSSENMDDFNKMLNSVKFQ